MITLLVMTDGRGDCLRQSVASTARLRGPIVDRMIHDDSGDADYRAWLAAAFPQWRLVVTPIRAGFAGAYRSAWGWLRYHCTTEFVFSTEDDFEFVEDIDLHAMCQVMRHDPRLAQIALLRQSWNAQERSAGGIVQMDPNAYSECTDGRSWWLSHRKFFTTNPHLMRTAFARQHTWPDGPESEGRFGLELFAGDLDARCAFWGRRDDPPRVQHIGVQRIGTGY